MKQIYYSIIALLLICASCSDWLDVQPKTSTPEEELFSKEFGFQDALTAFYLKMGEPSLYGKELTYNYLDILAGRYTKMPDIYNNKDIYNYEGTFKSTKNTFYSGMYNIIANINNFLKYLETNRDVVKTPTYYEVMKGEALGLRAFLHFDLLRIFGPIYQLESSAKAIPYRLSFDNFVTPILPANEVVNLCLSDLHRADSLLDKYDSEIFEQNKGVDEFLEMRQFRMNKWAVKAMLARVYCYKGDVESKSKAVQYAKEVIESNRFELHELNTDNPILFNEHIFSLNIYELYKIVDADFLYRDASSILCIAKDSIKLLYGETEATDFRKNTSAFRSLKSSSQSEIMVLCKYDQTKYTSYSATIYSGINSMPLIRLPEMYYIVSECETDPYISSDYLDMVRFKRAIPMSDATIVNENYDRLDIRPSYDREHSFRINEILKEYQKEFYGEGQLFYFYKRHNYKRFFQCPLSDIRSKYQLPLHENEHTFGNNN